MSFIQYDSRRDICSPANHVIPSRDFQQHQHHHQPQQHGGSVNTSQTYGSSEGSGTTSFLGVKSGTAPFVDRLPYMPMSTTSGFIGPDPTSGLAYPFYNFDAMHAAAELSGNIGGGRSALQPEVDFRAALTSSDGLSMASDGVAGLQRFADYRTNAITTAAGGFLPSDRTPYINGGTVHPVSVNSVSGQQMSPQSAATPTSPTTVVYPWMTIVGQFPIFTFMSLNVVLCNT